MEFFTLGHVSITAQPMTRPYLLKYPTDRGEISHAYSGTLAGKDYAFKTHI